MTTLLWRCGHPKTPENTKAASPSTRARCRTCHAARVERWRIANTNSGGKRGRPSEFLDLKPIGFTDGDASFRDMTTRGTRMLSDAIDRYLGRIA